MWTENRLVRISFTLKKALADEVVWDYLNQDTEWVKRTRREEEDKETGREEVGESCLINIETALWQWVNPHIYQTSVKWRNPYGLA